MDAASKSLNLVCTSSGNLVLATQEGKSPQAFQTRNIPCALGVCHLVSFGLHV